MFGAQLYNVGTSWDQITSVLRVMEAGTWTSAYVYDHFVPPLGGRGVELRPNLEGWMLLGGMAAVTTRLELGALVSGNTYRNPALLAKMAVTLDEVSKGRAILGIGAGWHAREHEAYGWDFPSLRERCDRLEEACQLIRMLFHAGPQELVNYEGKYYRLTEAPFVPNHYRGAGPRGRRRRDAIPIMVGGKGRKRTLKTLAQYGDIMNVISSPEEFKQECEVLDRHCEAVGRDPAEISRTVHIPLRIMDDEHNAKELRAGDDWKPIGSVQRVIDKCGDFIAAGVEEFCFAAIPQHAAVYQRLNEEVLPAFSRGLL